MDEETKIYNRIKEQKANYKKDKLTKEQIEKLESLPNWTWR